MTRSDETTRLKATVERRVRDQLDRITCDRARAEGRALAVEAAVELALTACDAQRPDPSVAVPLPGRSGTGQGLAAAR